MPTQLPHHRVPPGLLMVMYRDETEALARARQDPANDADRPWAVDQWRCNVAAREVGLDGDDDPAGVAAWHFPQGRRPCPDTGTCHHGCGPLAGCWRVSHCGPLSLHGDAWTLAERIAHERPGGTL